MKEPSIEDLKRAKKFNPFLQTGFVLFAFIGTIIAVGVSLEMSPKQIFWMIMAVVFNFGIIALSFFVFRAANEKLKLKIVEREREAAEADLSARSEEIALEEKAEREFWKNLTVGATLKNNLVFERLQPYVGSAEVARLFIEIAVRFCDENKIEIEDEKLIDLLRKINSFGLLENFDKVWAKEWVYFQTKCVAVTCMFWLNRFAGCKNDDLLRFAEENEWSDVVEVKEK